MRKTALRSLGFLFLGLLLAVPVLGASAGSAPATVAPVAYLPLVQRTCAPVELLQDGGFEAGLPNPVWQTTSNVGSSILDNTPGLAHSGTWGAWLGGDNNRSESLWQTFSVPAGVQGLKISYWWKVSTAETKFGSFDTLKVQIRDASGNWLQDLHTLDNGNASSTWQQSTFTVSGYDGQTIQLAFVANTDGTYPTSFFIDDVSVLKTCPNGLTTDVTGDCKVNVIDIEEAAAHLGVGQNDACYAAPYDQDNSGVIDIGDVQAIANQWRRTAP